MQSFDKSPRPDDESGMLSSSPPAYDDFDSPDYSAAKGGVEAVAAESYALYSSQRAHGAEATLDAGPSGSLRLSSRSSSEAGPTSPASWTSARGGAWSGAEVRFWHRAERRVKYIVRIPSKREGWKAEVSGLDEQQTALASRHVDGKKGHTREPHQAARWTPRYEVRREALARRVDFWHQPEGLHNVMTPSSRPAIGAPRAFTCEAPDGQALVWQRNGIEALRSPPFRTSWTLLSRPSMVVVARYVASSQAIASSSSGPSSPTRAQFFEEREGHRALGEHGTLQGTLTIMTMDDHRHQGEALDVQPIVLSRQLSRTSAASDEEHARLARAHKRPLCLGLAVPGVLAAAATAPHLAASWNRRCLFGDDLANLGRTRVGIKTKSPKAESLSGKAPNNVVGAPATAERLADLNRSESNRNRSDARPRQVELDFIVASLVAALDA